MENELNMLFDKQIQCPCCNFKFSTKKVRTSRLRLLSKDELLLNSYKDINPTKYSIYVCPNCGYSASERKYEKQKEHILEKIRQEVTPHWNPRDFGGLRNEALAIEAYKLAFYQAVITNSSNFDIGSISFNLGALYRLIDNKNQEKRFFEIARDKLEVAYNTETLSGNMDDTTLSYLIGKLSFELDELEKANKWLITSIQSPGIRRNNFLNNLAREQWKLVKDTISSEN